MKNRCPPTPHCCIESAHCRRDSTVWKRVATGWPVQYDPSYHKWLSRALPSWSIAAAAGRSGRDWSMDRAHRNSDRRVAIAKTDRRWYRGTSDRRLHYPPTIPLDHQHTGQCRLANCRQTRAFRQSRWETRGNLRWVYDRQRRDIRCTDAMPHLFLFGCSKRRDRDQMDFQRWREISRAAKKNHQRISIGWKI